MPEIDLKKYSVAEVVLLAVFVLGLAIAYFIVQARSDITLSRTIELPGSGLQISMPAGLGWKSDMKWKYGAGAYSCIGLYGRDGTVATQVTVQYVLAADKVRIDDEIAARASQFGGTMDVARRFDEVNFEMHAAQIDIPRARAAMIIAAGSLGMGRMVVIEVLDRAGEADWAWQVVEKIAAALKYKPDVALDAGSRIVGALKSRGLDAWFQRQGHEKFFLISDRTDTQAGFVANLYGGVPNSRLGLRFVTAYYLRKQGGQESVLQCDSQLKQWLWLSSALASGGSRTGRVEAYLDPDGQMTVKGLSIAVPTCRPGPAALPELVVEAAFSEMADANVSSAIFDVIDAQGRIVPTNVRITRNPDRNWQVQAQSLDDAAEVDTTLFDPNMNVIKTSIADKVKLDLRPAARADVLSTFEPWADYLDSLDSLLHSTQPPRESPRRQGYNDPTI